MAQITIKDIEGFPNYQLVETLGDVEVYSKLRNKYLKPGLDRCGYKMVSLNGKSLSLHRLIALHLIDNPNPEKFKVVDHIDNNRKNNKISNLRWVSNSMNHVNSPNNVGYDWYKRDNKWRARIQVNNTRIHLGYFIEKADARKAFLDARDKYYPEANGQWYDTAVLEETLLTI